MTERSVLLLATNKKEYLQFAINCAESIKIHNPGLPIFIVTNIDPVADIPGIKFLPVKDELARLYIETKLYLDTFLQTAETLFIDSDCLCFSSLDPIFNACKGMDVTVIGRPVPLENYWGDEKDAEYARKEFSIDRSILFNGGFYYINNTPVTKRIFDKAREISAKYDEYGFNRIQNNWKNEEDLMSIAMIANKQHPISDDSTYMTDCATDQRPQILNVLKGKRVLRNPANKLIQKRSWYPPTFSPIILHFGGSNIKSYPYISQSALIKLYKKGFSIPVSSLIVYAFIHIPYKAYHWVRKTVGLR